jgi:hypothetical protein
MAKLGKALMSLFLDKKARAALEAKSAAAKAAAQQASHQPPLEPIFPANEPPPLAPTREEIHARLSDAQDRLSGRVGAPDRRQLINDALKVRADKAKMLEDLPEEQRRRLQALAMASFMKARPGG